MGAQPMWADPDNKRLYVSLSVETMLVFGCFQFVRRSTRIKQVHQAR